MNDMEKVDTLKKLISEGFDFNEAIEIAEEIDNDNDDFCVADYRFIKKSDIDQIMSDELSGDTYMLGCFNANFIADILEIDSDVVESAQKSESFEGLGVSLLPHIDQVVENYVAEDGYGHHFSSYDGEEHDFEDYYYFKC